jgi:hypothetical protein
VGVSAVALAEAEELLRRVVGAPGSGGRLRSSPAELAAALRKLGVDAVTLEKVLRFRRQLEASPAPGVVYASGVTAVREPLPKDRRKLHVAFIDMVSGRARPLRELAGIPRSAWIEDVKLRRGEKEVRVEGTFRFSAPGSMLIARSGPSGGLAGVNPKDAERLGYDPNLSFWVHVGLKEAPDKFTLLVVRLPLRTKEARLVLAGTFEVYKLDHAPYRSPEGYVRWYTAPLRRQ